MNPINTLYYDEGQYKATKEEIEQTCMEQAYVNDLFNEYFNAERD